MRGTANPLNHVAQQFAVLAADYKPALEIVMTTTEPTNKPEQAQSNRGTASVNNALFHLWGKSASTLTTEELEWFSGLTNNALNTTENLSNIVQSIGCMVNEDNGETGYFQNSHDVFMLMWNLSEQLDTIAGMIHIGTSAADRLQHPDWYKKSDLIKASHAAEAEA